MIVKTFLRKIKDVLFDKRNIIVIFVDIYTAIEGESDVGEIRVGR